MQHGSSRPEYHPIDEDVPELRHVQGPMPPPLRQTMRSVSTGVVHPVILLQMLKCENR
jgi:hypothetical protein